MDTRRMTNVLLLSILLALVALILARLPIKEVTAETFKLDNCITTGPYDKPEAYVHVIVHDVSPVQAESEVR